MAVAQDAGSNTLAMVLITVISASSGGVLWARQTPAYLTGFRCSNGLGLVAEREMLAGALRSEPRLH